MTKLLPMAQTLHSQIDASVNFVSQLSEREALEARFVRRNESYIVVYLSCQTACAQACRFCHLTATGQTKGRDATVAELHEQASKVLAYYAVEVEAGRQKPTKVVHFNFMARGEPLSSRVLLEEGVQVMDMLHQLARAYSLTPAVKISTIGVETGGELLDIFPYQQPDYYYSIYSMDAGFRKKWLPKAPDPTIFLEKLARWQEVTNKIPTIHHAVIEWENSSLTHPHGIIEAVNSAGLAVNVNLVRYNPPTPRHGVEPAEDVLNSHVELYRAAWPNMKAKVVTKVGYDVAASCGMFVGGRANALEM